MVVAHEPGPWFDETLASLGAQTYAALDVVVIDSSGAPVAGRDAERRARHALAAEVTAESATLDQNWGDDDWGDDNLGDGDEGDGWADGDLDSDIGDDGDVGHLGEPTAIDRGPESEPAEADGAATATDDASAEAVPGAGDLADSLARWVHEALPDATVVSVAGASGFAPAANFILETECGSPAYLLICHDDVALRNDAIATLVAEAGQSNAAIVGPKLVRWNDPTLLLEVGWEADKFGVVDPVVEPGEVDQEQHDAVRDVFAVPAACMLVRADMFATLGGFDEVMTFRGEDVDLCWRAQVAGARVVVAPDAVVRHRAGLVRRRRVDDTRITEARHRLRMVLCNYNWLHRLRVLPQLALLTLVEVVVAAVTLHPTRARAVLGAWPWNLRRGRQIARRRRALAAIRRLEDSEIRALQLHGSAQLNRGVRRLLRIDEQGGFVESTRRALSDGLSDTPVRNAAMVWIGIISLYLLGSRHLLGEVPAVGELAAFPDSARQMVSHWWSGWRPVGLGDAGGSPIAEAFLGVLGLALFGATDLARRALVLGLLPVGLVGAWRMLAPIGSRRARIGAVSMYAATPVAFNSLARANLTGLVAYAAAPWILARMMRALGPRSWGVDEARGATGRFGWGQLILSLGLTMASAAALSPFLAVVPVLVLAGLVTGGVAAGSPGRVHRLFTVTVGGAGVAAVLHLPWLLDLTSGGGDWASVGLVGSGEPGTEPLGDLLRFDTGPIGGGPAAWLLLVPPALPLVVARDVRLTWAIRGWAIALAAWAALWAGEWGLLDVALPPPEALLAVAAAGLATATGMGVAAFDVDLGSARWSWRRAMAACALAAFVVAAAPVAAASLDGRWELPRSDFRNSFSLLDPADPRVAAEATAGDGGDASFRTLWVGDPEVLPAAGWPLVGDLAIAVSDDGPPTIAHRWVDEPSAGIDELRRALSTVIDGDTNRLGALLAPFGVRYVVLVNRLAPEPFGEIERPVPDEVTDGLSEQLDLRRVDGVNLALDVYENAVWLPIRSAAPLAEGVASVTLGGVDDMARFLPVLADASGARRFDGVVLGDHEVYVAYAPDESWALTVAGERSTMSPLGTSGMLFVVGEGGDGSLTYEPTSRHRTAALLQAVAWVVAVLGASRLRSGSRRHR